MKIKRIDNDGSCKNFTMENGDWLPFDWTPFRGAMTACAEFDWFEGDDERIFQGRYIAILYMDFYWDEKGTHRYVDVEIQKIDSREMVVKARMPISDTMFYKPTQEYYLKKITQAFYESMKK